MKHSKKDQLLYKYEPLSKIDHLYADLALKYARLDIFAYVYSLYTSGIIGRNNSGQYQDFVTDPIFDKLRILGYTPQGTDFELMKNKEILFDSNKFYQNVQDYEPEENLPQINPSKSVQKNYANEFVYRVVAILLPRLTLFYRNMFTRLAYAYFFSHYADLTDLGRLALPDEPDYIQEFVTTNYAPMMQANIQPNIEYEYDRFLLNLCCLNDIELQVAIIKNLDNFAVPAPFRYLLGESVLTDADVPNTGMGMIARSFDHDLLTKMSKDNFADRVAAQYSRDEIDVFNQVVCLLFLKTISDESEQSTRAMFLKNYRYLKQNVYGRNKWLDAQFVRVTRYVVALLPR